MFASQIEPTDCAFNPKYVFNQGDQVCVFGDVDVTPPGEFFPAGWVIVAPADAANPYADIKDAPNYVIGASLGGAFYDEVALLPPLPPGKFQLILDEYPFGSNGGEDTFGPTFTVTNVPSNGSVDVNAIKAAAEKGLEAALGIQNLTTALTVIDSLSTVADWTGAFGLGGGVAGVVVGTYCFVTNTDCPTSYNSGVIAIGNKILSGLSKALQAKYGGIIKDPPDPNFLVTAPLRLSETQALGGPWSLLADKELPRRQAAIAKLLAVQAASYEAMLPTLERLQGAEAAGDNVGLMLQSEKVVQYSELAIASGDAMLVEADALESFLASNANLETSFDMTTPLSAIASDSYTSADIAFMSSFGLDDAAIATVKSELGALALPDKVSWKAALDELRATFKAMRPTLVSTAADAEALRKDASSKAFWTGPTALVAGPASGTAGQKLTFTASATHYDPKATLSYSWDTDEDGVFDDGSGATIDIVPPVAGKQFVSVKVSDGKLEHVAHAVLDVAIGNRPPELTNLAPSESSPFAKVGETVAFAATATDPDGDAVTLRWLVDGEEKATGGSLDFAMPDEEPHEIVLVASDGNSFSADARAKFTVRAAKWKAAIEEGSGGASGATSGSGSGGSGSGGSGSSGAGAGGADADGTDEDASGCGCSVPGEQRGGGTVAIAGLLAALGLRRRRVSMRR